MTDNLHKFVVLQGKPWELLERLKTETIFKGHESGEKTIQEMELLFTYLDAMGVLDNILFDFSLARGLDYYTGLIYEAVLTGSDRGSIAGGGRYDGLVGMFSGKVVPAIGVSIGIERVFAILEEKAKNEKIRATKTQILIAQVGKNLTAERMKIVGEMWRNGICAETLYFDNPKPQKQLDYAFDNGIPLVMWIGEDEVARGVVKIKSLSFHTEVIVERAQLVNRVKELIAENPVLLSQEEQAQMKEQQAKASVVQVTGDRAVFDELEGILAETQWVNGGMMPSAADREWLDRVKENSGLLDPKAYPNVFGWYSFISKFSPEKLAELK